MHQCRAFSLRDARWRYVHWLDEPEQLFDLQADPQEFNDLGRDASTSAVRAAMREKLLGFLARRRHRTTLTDAQIAARDRAAQAGGGVLRAVVKMTLQSARAAPGRVRERVGA